MPRVLKVSNVIILCNEEVFCSNTKNNFVEKCFVHDLTLKLRTLGLEIKKGLTKVPKDISSPPTPDHSLFYSIPLSP